MNVCVTYDAWTTNLLTGALYGLCLGYWLDPFFPNPITVSEYQV